MYRTVPPFQQQHVVSTKLNLHFNYCNIQVTLDAFQVKMDASNTERNISQNQNDI